MAESRTTPSAARRDTGASAITPSIPISIFGCAPDEARAFREMAPRFGVAPTIIDATLSEATIHLAIGSRCVSVGHTAHIANPLLRSLGELGVEYLSTRSSGHDHIDVDFARGVGIRVESVAYSPDSVADYALMLMLMALRNARSIITRAEAKDFRLNSARGRELRDLTVGVVGTGRIGAAVVDRLHGFGCAVLAHDRRPKTAADYVDLDELLERSDLITLHTPLSADTRHLLNRERIGRMKARAVIVNTGRGALIDTDSLVSALENGKLGGAALDVVEGEEGIFSTDRRNRPIENELFVRLQRLPNVLITPHTAFRTERALYDTVANTLRNCLEFEGRRDG